MSTPLEDIVLEEDVRERIRPLFERATASTEFSFEHDFQWQAYCDVLYGINVCQDKIKETITLYGIPTDYEEYEKAIETEFITCLEQIPKKIKALSRYSAPIKKVLQDAFWFGTFPVPSVMDIPKMTDYVEKLIRYSNENTNAMVLFLSKYRVYQDEILPLPSLSEEEIMVLDNYFSPLTDEQERIMEESGRWFCRAVPRIILNILCEKEYKNQSATRVQDAIECASIEIPGYKVINRIGEGRRRVTYKAWNKQDECYVAIKVRKPSNEVTSPNKKFIDEKYGAEGLSDKEGTSARLLTHPSIVRYFERGTLGDGRSYIIEEFVDGKTLKEIIDETDYDPALHTAWRCILSEALEGLSYIHEEGFVHRDIKPENILVPSDGADTNRNVKIGDLELLKKLEGREEITNSHGSNAYCAPELFRDQRLTKRADVFSFGLVMCEAFTGQHAFVFQEDETDDREKISQNICNPDNYERVMKEIDQNTAIPKCYKPIIKGCLLYDPEQRFYSDARDLLYYFRKAEREQHNYANGLMRFWVKKREYKAQWMILVEQELTLQPQRPYRARFSALKRFFSL